MKVYVLQEFTDSHNCGTETLLIGAFDSKEKVRAKIQEIKNQLTDPHYCFFMDYLLEDDYELTDFDSKDITADGMHLYCDGNGDEYDLYYNELEVE